MFISDCLGVNNAGHLTIGGCDTVFLASVYGTPLMVFDGDAIRKNCRELNSAFKKYYDGNGRVLYASKAFDCKAMCRLADEEDLGLDVVSGGEIYTALKAGFPAGRMYFHGNNKTDEEIRLALKNGVGRIIVDNPCELKRLDLAAKELGFIARILMRITPGIDAHTHDFIRTGQIDSKFGFTLTDPSTMEYIRAAHESPNIELMGLHCHIASQVFDVDPFIHAAEVMMDFIAKIKTEVGAELSELDLGGGFGIKYTEDEKPLPLGDYIRPVSETVKSYAAKLGLKVPFILIEPGRSLVGGEAVTLYKVGNVKEIPGVRTYVCIDGGMSDNPRYALYQAKYTAVCANKADKPFDTSVTIAGKCCESGDMIGENMPLQKVGVGDIVAILGTGAYNYSMASNYNRIPRPEVLMINDGTIQTVIKRETYEQIIVNDI